MQIGIKFVGARFVVGFICHCSMASCQSDQDGFILPVDPEGILCFQRGCFDWGLIVLVGILAL